MQLLEHGGVDDLAGLDIDKAFCNLIEFFASCIVRHSFDHAVRTGGNHHGVKCMVAITFIAYLNQTPARS